ncbi:hypothetical protein ACFSO0_18875 [Brevibacillus sp. GCM10020057]|uniref:hypothetical protein n=1 Tax=Brevibacillus sp. GCM10020057 TaxID=3317327 RepID=UPI003635A879
MDALIRLIEEEYKLGIIKHVSRRRRKNDLYAEKNEGPRVKTGVSAAPFTQGPIVFCPLRRNC